jgi:hypothetical protein
VLRECPIAISEKDHNTSHAIILVVAGWGRGLVDDSQIGNAIVIEVRGDGADR